jgi:hypothetical protein
VSPPVSDTDYETSTSTSWVETQMSFPFRSPVIDSSHKRPRPHKQCPTCLDSIPIDLDKHRRKCEGRSVTCVWKLPYNKSLVHRVNGTLLCPRCSESFSSTFKIKAWPHLLCFDCSVDSYFLETCPRLFRISI